MFSPITVRDFFSSSPVTLKDDSTVSKAELVENMMNLDHIVQRDPLFFLQLEYSDALKALFLEHWGCHS